ncbi:hypothetical protein X801_05089 [Opisthorchis viverrini]|uniref:Uncharacterized protein n=1 Tax=Opisthorchis viverrini TaxID=6198 RepID=A0A1S8WWZ8_OPIVI|nr:hypothetical protein X801_05089 [Opisthorchis viverrini]
MLQIASGFDPMDQDTVRQPGRIQGYTVAPLHRIHKRMSSRPMLLLNPLETMSSQMSIAATSNTSPTISYFDFKRFATRYLRHTGFCYALRPPYT